MPPPDLGPWKTRRCYVACQYFDNDGHRIQKGVDYGCPRSPNSCHFIHPTDPEWTSAPAGSSSSLLSRIETWRPAGKTSPPRSPPSSSTSFRARERRPSYSIDHHAVPADSSSKRWRSPPRGSSAHTHHSDRSPILLPRSPRRGASPPRHRHRSSSTTTHDAWSLPHRTSSTDRPLSYPPQPDPAPPKGDYKPPPSKMGSDDRSSGKEGSLKSPALPAASTTFKAPAETTSTKAPSASSNVASRTFSEVLPPPPSMNPASSRPREEMTATQRRALWEKRVGLMADATQEYMDLGKLEKDVESRRRQVQSPAFSTLPSEIQNAFNANLANATTTCERKKAALNKALNKLSETDFWPTIPTQNVGDMEVKLKEAKTMLGGLADRVGQLYKRLESLYGQRNGHSNAGPSEGATVASSGDGHAKKRRRLSVDGTSIAAVDTTSPEMCDDVESIRDTIREIEDRLEEMENDMSQQSRNIVEQLDAKMDEKIEEIARSTDISALVGDRQLGPQTAQTIQTFHENFAQADREITELAQDVADLIPQLDELRRESVLSEQEGAAEKELLEKLMKADQDNAEAITRLQEEAKTLRSALTAHAKRGLPPTPAMPLSAPFMEAIKESIITQVQEQILPIVTRTRTEMEHVAKTRDTELYEKLKDKLDQGLKMSQLISTWIESNPDDARQALAAATAKAQASGAGSSSSVLT